MTSQSWYEHFKSKIEASASDFDYSSADIDSLKECLNQKIINDNEYLIWASPKFELPILTSDFFNQTKVNPQVFLKWATQFDWSDICLPVAEWDGSLIVACLQPPNDFPFENTIFTIAGYEDLRSTWQLLSGQQKNDFTSSSIESSQDIPDGLQFENLTKTSAKSDSFSFDDLGVVVDSEDASNDNHLSDGTDLQNPNEEKEDLLDLSFESAPSSLSPVATNTNTNSETESLSALSENMLLNSIQSSLGEPLVNTGTTKSIPAPPPKAKDATPPHIMKIVSDSDEVTRINADPLAETSDLFDDSNSSKGLSGLSPTQTAGLVYSSYGLTSSVLEKMKKTDREAFEYQVEKVFSNMQTKFRKAMLLSTDDQSRHFTPYVWTENFGTPNDGNQKIQLTEPSIFRIAYSTMKPFHGYITPNSINELFFDIWNLGSYPDHVTLVPIIVNSEVVGALLGIGDKANYNSKSLILAEEQAATLNTTLDRAA